jgi:hypothetical protein
VTDDTRVLASGRFGWPTWNRVEWRERKKDGFA